MAKYRITAPDGNAYEVTAPDDATEAQVLAYAQQNYQQPQAGQPASKPPLARAETLDPSEGGGSLQFATPWKTYDTGIPISQGVNRALAGVGKSFVDTPQGIGQLLGMVSQEEVDDRRRLDAPLMATGAGLAGNIVGQTAQIAVPVPGAAAAKLASVAGRAAPYIGAGARAAAFTALQPMATGQNRGVEAAKSAGLGIAGQGVASGLGALARGARSRMDEAGAALAQKAESLGIKLGIPQLSENPFVRTVASQMERLPFSGATKRTSANRDEFNRRVAETFGATGSKITPDVFAKAKAAISNGFERLTQKNNLQITPDHVAGLKTILDEATRLGGSDTARMVKGWADELLSKVDKDGVIPGKAYQSFDSRIGKVLKAGGEPAHYLGMLRDTVRTAMDDSISAGDRATWNTLRKQWAAMKTVEPLVSRAADGSISPAALMGRVTADSAGKARMATGQAGALGDLARIGQRFLKEAPNSGTADRALVNLAVGGGLWGAQEKGWISPETAMWTAGGLLANRAGLSALNSRALAAGDSRALSGLARLVQPAPRALPAAVQASTAGIPIVGGRVATPEDIARDEEIVRRFREGR